MALKDLLVTIDASDAGTARMELAMRLAKRHRARLIGYYVSPTIGTYDLPPAAPLAGMPTVGPLPTPDNEPPLLVADCRRLANELGWRPKLDLATGMAQTVRHWQQRFER